jgi:3'-phosphoadenosine 5'-phosphosulfate sulfotransferase (PAPS reductase)/FAD synthetase
MSQNGSGVRHVLSFGGGVNTVALMVLLLRSKEPLDEAVFADTGGEVPETYECVEWAKGYLADHGIPFQIVSNINGHDLYGTAWRRKVIPSAVWRWSTRDYKVRPIHRYYRSLGSHINQYIGIAYDEIERMKDSGVPYITNLYPLVDMKITRAGCEDIIQGAGLPVPVKSGCFFCPFNSADRWRWLHETHPDLFDKAIALEENSKHFPRQRLTDQVYRKRAVVPLRTLSDLIVAGKPIPMNGAQNPCGGACMT